jgi:toxin-antitoxin system PIN domain toxin
MKSSGDAGWLPDVNIWIALTSDRHEHHTIAREWFDSVSDRVLFCRVTQMSFLRLLTNPKVMGDELLTPSYALHIYREFLDDERVEFAAEAQGVERTWTDLMTSSAVTGNAWTDAYLAAFALESQTQLVSLDQGMRRWPALCLILQTS